MLSFVTNRGGLLVPLSNAKRFLLVSDNFKNRLVTASKLAAVITAAAGILAFAYTVHLPNLIRFPGSTPAINSNVVSTKLVTNNSNSCSLLQRQENTLFSKCPSFYIDYSGQNDGPVGNSIFNVYVNQPATNNEAQYYTDSRQNLNVSNGSLNLIALSQALNGYKYTSSRIDTHGKEDFLYGKMVIRAKIPGGIGTWPSIWLLPSDSKYAKLSPASDPNRYLNDGEIDIAEAVGTEPHVIYGIAHSLAYPEDGVNRAYFNTTTVPGSDTAYHDYGLEWTPTKLTFTVDGKMYFTYTKKANADYRSWPFDQPFYLVMNLALGGDWGGMDKAEFPGDGVDKSALPASLQIQAIRYYSYTGSH